MRYETIAVRQDGAVWFADIAAPPMSLLGADLVRDLVSVIRQAEADSECGVVVFTSADPDYFISHADAAGLGKNGEQAAKLTVEPSVGMLFRELGRKSVSHC
jgi:enoyl-CoA hydratase/carnithine racemase